MRLVQRYLRGVLLAVGKDDGDLTAATAAEIARKGLGSEAAGLEKTAGVVREGWVMVASGEWIWWEGSKVLFG